MSFVAVIEVIKTIGILEMKLLCPSGMIGKHNLPVWWLRVQCNCYNHLDWIQLCCFSSDGFTAQRRHSRLHTRQRMHPRFAPTRCAADPTLCRGVKLRSFHLSPFQRKFCRPLPRTVQRLDPSQNQVALWRARLRQQYDHQTCVLAAPVLRISQTLFARRQICPAKA